MLAARSTKSEQKHRTKISTSRVREMGKLSDERIDRDGAGKTHWPITMIRCSRQELSLSWSSLPALRPVLADRCGNTRINLIVPWVFYAAMFIHIVCCKQLLCSTKCSFTIKTNKDSPFWGKSTPKQKISAVLLPDCTPNRDFVRK